MRLYPPAEVIGRTIHEPLEFGGWHAPAGAAMLASQLVMHRDPRWFPEPDLFDPDRWLDERRDDVPKYAFLPFGTGPRACIGEQFAWAEATSALAVIAARWRIHTAPEVQPENPEPDHPASRRGGTDHRDPAVKLGRRLSGATPAGQPTSAASGASTQSGRSAKPLDPSALGRTASTWWICSDPSSKPTAAPAM